MFEKIYLWVESLAIRKNARKWLYFISFAESSFFPIPPDVLLIPICLQNIKKCYLIAIFTTFYSVIGGIVGYLIGAYAIEFAMQMIKSLGYQNQFENIQNQFNQWGVLFVLIAGFTPLPYKIIAITSGMTGFNLILFILTSIVGRGGRFLLLALLIHNFGDSMNLILKKYITPIGYGCVFILILYLIYRVFFF